MLQVPFDGCVQAALVPVQTSEVQPLPSSVQVVPPGLKASAGQTLPLPGQLSARSHSPAGGRHTVVADANPSAGQAPDEPVQLSATSHWPAEGRHVVVAGLKPSLQLPAPSQESVASHAPPLDVPTQVVVADANPSAGQAPD